jgi:hypothetical protein
MKINKFDIVEKIMNYLFSFLFRITKITKIANIFLLYFLDSLVVIEINVLLQQ